MSREEEQLKILQMVAEGKLTPEAAARLLSALNAARDAGSEARRRARVMRVIVTDLGSGKPRVNVNLPVGLLTMGLRMGQKVMPEVKGVEFDPDELQRLLREGFIGHLVDVIDEEEGERVEVILE